MRLDKLIEQQLQTSRKEMKQLFRTRQVRVDGEVCLQQNKNVDSFLHEITVANQVLQTHDVYYLLNKPKGVVTANADQEHLTVFDLLHPADFRSDLVAAGRLDRDTKGLLLLTSNGQLVYDLLHPTKKVIKTYEARINAEVTQEDIVAFADGIVFLDGTVCQSAPLTIVSYDEQSQTSAVRLQIQEGKFHQVKKMFLARGKKVMALKRVAMGPLELGTLPEAQYRALSSTELQQLKPYFR